MLYVFAMDMIIPLILILKGVCDLQTRSFRIGGGLGCSLPSDHPKQTGSWVPNCCMNLLSLSLIDPPLNMEVPDFHETLLMT